jgi:hypothetical protein
MRYVFVLSLLLASGACGRAASAPKPFAPNEVVELSALPDGFELAGSLSESCRVASPGELDDARLSDVDCSFARLSRTLRARAGEGGARFLIGKQCRSSSERRLSCSAQVARASSAVPLAALASANAEPAPSPAQVQDGDEPRPQDASRIRVSFAAREGARLRPARAYDRVEETRYPAVGRQPLGQLSARCDQSCPEPALRHALRVTAGRVGAGEVSQVSCFEEGSGSRCVATALEPWSF